MPNSYPIIVIDPALRGKIEDMGSKPKFWFRREGDERQWLFKQARANTGEHWAEKVASEIAALLGLPTHQVELAHYEDQVGCAVRSFLGKAEVLVHGNEILAGTIEGYDKDKMRGQADHNFENIVAALERWFPGDRLREVAASRIVGYLVLDALVGNTDRHHENWGITLHLVRKEGEDFVYGIKIAPTFDHGSSLGREMLDERRRRILDDEDALPRYIRKARGGVFHDANAKRGLSPIALVELIAERYPEFFRPWRERREKLDPVTYEEVVARVPDDWMSPTAKEFSLAFLSNSRKLLLCIQ